MKNKILLLIALIPGVLFAADNEVSIDQTGDTLNIDCLLYTSPSPRD